MVSTEMSGTAVKFNWIEPYAGGDGISMTEYELNVFSKHTNSFYSYPIATTLLSYEIEMNDLVGTSTQYKYI